MKPLYIGLGLVIIIVVVAIVYKASNSGESNTEPLVSNTDVVSVDVTPLSADVSVGENVIQSATPAPDGSVVKTSADGRAIITHDSDIVSSLDNNSEITLSFGADKKQTKIRITSGRIWSKVARALEQDEVFEVYTPTMVAAVRGTSFGVSLDPKRSLIVTEGTVYVTRRDSKTGELIANSTITVTAGQTLEDDGINFIVRPTTLSDKDSWYANNNLKTDSTEETSVKTPSTQFNPVVTKTPTSPGEPTSTSTNNPPLTENTLPTITSISPDRFDLELVDLIRINGENLEGVTRVLLNTKPTEFVVTRVGVLTINTSKLQDGYGIYDIALESNSGNTTLKNAFEVIEEDIVLKIEETLMQYNSFNEPFIVVRGPGIGYVDNVLVDGQIAEFSIFSSTELHIFKVYPESVINIEVRFRQQSAFGTLTP